MKFLAFCFILGFCSSFLFAWNFYFPTPTERLIWRIASIYTLAFGIIGGIYTAVWHYKLPRASSLEAGEDSITMRSRRSWAIRDSAIRGDGGLKVSKTFLVPVTVLSACYCLARGYILVEDIIGLRKLPKSAYNTIE